MKGYRQQEEETKNRMALAQLNAEAPGSSWRAKSRSPTS